MIAGGKEQGHVTWRLSCQIKRRTCAPQYQQTSQHYDRRIPPKMKTSFFAITALVTLVHAAPLFTNTTNEATKVDEEYSAHILSYGVHALTSTTGEVIDITLTESVRRDDKNCAWKNRHPLGFCVDICRETEYRTCVNNICGPPCSIIVSSSPRAVNRICLYSTIIAIGSKKHGISIGVYRK